MAFRLSELGSAACVYTISSAESAALITCDVDTYLDSVLLRSHSVFCWSSVGTQNKSQHSKTTSTSPHLFRMMMITGGEVRELQVSRNSRRTFLLHDCFRATKQCRHQRFKDDLDAKTVPIYGANENYSPVVNHRYRRTAYYFLL